MKIIKIVGFTVFLTVLFLQSFDAYGHLPCSSEESAVDSAERAYNNAQSAVEVLEAQINTSYFAGCNSDNIMDLTNAGVQAGAARVQLKDAKKKRDDAKKKLDDARSARDKCVENDRRNCVGRCSKMHTQSVTTCDCQYPVACDCGPSSASSSYLEDN